MYKTKLQELCHRRSWRLPEYTTTRDGTDHNPRFFSSVTVNGESFKTLSPSKSSKLSQNDAAQLAFLHFTSSVSSPSPLSPSPPPSPGSSVVISEMGSETPAGGIIQQLSSPGNNPIDRTAFAVVARNGSSVVISEMGSEIPAGGIPQQPSSLGNNPTVGTAFAVVARNDEKIIDMERLYKNQLQSYTQKRKLALPVYSCEREGPPHASLFKCKVTVDGITYETQEFFTTLNKAELAAAKVALLSLLPNGVEEDESSYKNLLQELAQKEGYRLPTYSTTKSGEAHVPMFVSTVEIEGKSFTGQETKTKKQAEMNAAKVAYIALKQRKVSQNPTCLPPVRQEAVQISSSNYSDLAGNSSQNPAGISPARTGQVAVSFSSPSAQLDIPGNSSQGSTCIPPSKVPVQSSSSSLRLDLIAYLQQHVQPKLPFSNEQAKDESGLESSTDMSRASSSSGLPALPLPEHDMPRSSPDPTPDQVVSPSIEHLIKTSTSSLNCIIVHPRATTMTYPVGCSVLPFSDDEWVAVQVTPPLSRQ